jgi:ribose transport system permease protein
MCVITVNDLDLSIGAYVGFVVCVAGTWLNTDPLLGIAALAGGIGAYALLGALIHLRNLPSIVVTLGMSFVWLGISVLILPTPGGKSPDWVRSLMTLKPPFIPFPIIAGVVIALVTHFALMRTSYGSILRGSGGNPRAIERAGWSLLKTKVVMFSLSGCFGMLSGLSLIGLTTSADANVALRYTLLSIAGVILGGGEFIGGRVSPVGAVIGAMTLTLAGSFLAFLRISPDWQIGAQGAILIIVLALRAIIDRVGVGR